MSSPTCEVTTAGDSVERHKSAALRQVGRTDLYVSPVILGGNVFGWTADSKTSHAILDAFVDGGGNAIDTADVYSTWVPGHVGGESEALIGQWLKRSGKRNRVVIATKVGLGSAGRKGLAAAHIERAVEDSLRRLQTDRLDLYFSHADDAQVALEETLGAYHTLIAKGKVRVIGASNYTAARLQEALRISERESLASYQVLQPHYNLCERAGYEGQLEPVCRQHRLGVVPYCALARGFLTGKYRSEQDANKSVRGHHMKKHLDERGLRTLGALDQVARAVHATPAQVALAWLMARPGVTAPIASATSVAQVQELTAAMQLRLDDAAIGTLDTVTAAPPA